MKKLCFSGLISCGCLLIAAQTNGQTFGQNDMPIHVSPADHSQLIAYPEKNNIVVLRWSTGNEREVDHYVIEHSPDGVHFTPLHDVVSKGVIDGNADSSYQDEDSYPASPVNYYRLVTVLKDGTDLYSPAERVDVDERRIPVLKPTILHTGGTLRVDNFYERPLLIDLYTASGARVGSYLVNSTSFNINTAGLDRGILFYRICDERHALIDAGKILLQ